MAHYFIDKHVQPNGEYVVHAVGCKRMATDKQYLGDFNSVSHAMLEARTLFWRPSGCQRCAREWNSREALETTAEVACLPEAFELRARSG